MIRRIIYFQFLLVLAAPVEAQPVHVDSLLYTLKIAQRNKTRQRFFLC